MKLELYILPNSKKTEYVGIHNGMPKIRIGKKALNNEANDELIKFISSKLGISKSSVKIVHGSKGRVKLLDIDTVDLYEKIIGKLEDI